MNVLDHVFGHLQFAQDSLNKHISQHSNAFSMFLAFGNASEDHAPHKPLVQRTSRVIGEDHTAVAKPIRKRTIGWIPGDCACDRVKILPLFAREIEVWIDDPVFKECHPGYAQRDEELPMQEMTRHVGDRVLWRGALRAHIREHLTQMDRVVQKQCFH